MKKQFQFSIAILAFGMLALGTVAMAQRNAANRMMAGDTAFAGKAAQGSMAEVAMGKIAQDHAASQEVKDFGKKMIDDHTAIYDDLKQIAATKSMTLPAGLSAKDQATCDRLSKMSGAAFDRAYMDDMVRDHRTDIAEFRHEADHGTDPDLKAFAAKTLPVLEGHLQLAEKTFDQVKMSK